MTIYYSQHIPDALLDEITVVVGPDGSRRSFYGVGRDRRAMEYAARMNAAADRQVSILAKLETQAILERVMQ